MVYHAITYMTIEQVKSATIESIEEYLAAHFPVYLPQRIDSVQDAQEATELLSRYSAYAIYLRGVWVGIRVRKRVATKMGYSDIASEWLSKEELFSAAMDNAEMARDTIWQMLKTRAELNGERRFFHDTP